MVTFSVRTRRDGFHPSPPALLPRLPLRWQQGGEVVLIGHRGCRGTANNAELGIMGCPLIQMRQAANCVLIGYGKNGLRCGFRLVADLHRFRGLGDGPARCGAAWDAHFPACARPELRIHPGKTCGMSGYRTLAPGSGRGTFLGV